MKRILLMLAIVGTFAFQGCTVKDQTQVNNLAEVFEVTTSFSAANSYSRIITLNPPIYSSDMVLVYRLFDVVNGEDVWRTLPQAVYLPQGELDYNFDFTRNDVNIFLDSDFDLTTLSSSWTQSQVFRVVIIPGYFSNKNASSVDFSNYDEVVKRYNLTESQIKTIKN